jgi:hypothetical integral membrane protein (TIGR02206 family)
MAEFFAKEFNGPPFELLSLQHIAALAMVALVGLSLILLMKPATASQKKQVRLVLAIALLLNEIIWHLWNWSIDTWNLATMLPLHLCSILVWLSALMLLTRNQTIYEFGFLVGIAGALQGLLTPDLGSYSFPHFRYFQTFLSHGLLVITPLYMTFVEGKRPTWRSVGKVLLFGNLYALLVFGINFISGGNYLFIARKPETASLLDLFPPWPIYLIILELLLVLVVFLFYSPFAISDARKKKSAIKSDS